MPNILHVEVVERAAGAPLLRLWGDDPGQARTCSLDADSIGDLVDAAEGDYYGPVPVRLVQVGHRLFRWLDGADGWLSAEVAAAANSAEVLVLALKMPPGLAHLPWEVLHDGSGFLLHALNPPVLPVRWRPAAPAAAHPANRPLQLLFMASSPEDVRPILDYEREEHSILDATARWPLDLTVEESGSLEELGALVQDYGASFFDVLHLTGHAGHGNGGTPVFLLEDSEGRCVRATAPELARTLSHRIPLVFLSGCRTGQNAGDGEVRSLAEQLVASGFRAVMGWGRPVQDRDATLAARHLYQQLAAGEPLAVALARAHVRLREEGVRDWHLLRLFCAGDPPAALVTPLRAPGRRYTLDRPAEAAFLDPSRRTVRVATRSGFVGRRRLLQTCIRRLRGRDVPSVGLLLRGQGGRGKSSIAARLCDRLRAELQRVVVFGRLDEASLLNAWAAELLDGPARRELYNPELELRFRIRAALHRLAAAGHPPPLFVLDDFEQNQPGAADGDLSVAPHAAPVLHALCEALAHTGAGRVLVTCRYALPAPFSVFLPAVDVPPLDSTERQKQLLRLEQGALAPERDPELLDEALAAADGNPRLFEWLYAVLRQPELDHAALLAGLRHAEERFREDILARRLVATLPQEARALLGRMLLLAEPVPFVAVRVLAPDTGGGELRGLLGRAADLGLLDVTERDGEPHFRVPGQLGGPSPLLPRPELTAAPALAAAVFGVLFRLWWTEVPEADERRVLELIRLARVCGRTDELLAMTDRLAMRWNAQYRFFEVRPLLEDAILVAGRHPVLLLNLARAVGALGDVDAAGELLREAWARCPADERYGRSAILYHLSRWHIQRGELEEASSWLEQKLAIDEGLPNEGFRAITLGLMADVMAMRGQLEEALRIRREEELPVYERVGEERARAVALGKVAELLMLRGQVDEALKIRRGQVVPILEKLGDEHARAHELVAIADALSRQASFNDVLRIYREDCLPVFERLGDLHARAATLGRIAGVLERRGEVEEALRIRREEELPVYEQLGNPQSQAQALDNIAGLLEQLGDTDEALRIRRDQVLPILDRLGGTLSRAVVLGKVADALALRGSVDEARRIRLEEEFPLYERLGEVRILISRRTELGMRLVLSHRLESYSEAVEHLYWAYTTAATHAPENVSTLASFLGYFGIPLPTA